MQEGGVLKTRGTAKKKEDFFFKTSQENRDFFGGGECGIRFLFFCWQAKIPAPSKQCGDFEILSSNWIGVCLLLDDGICC